MSRKGPWLDVIRDEVSRGLHTYRVHVLRAPLTDYERFEFEWGFVLNEQAGEHIRILDLTEQLGAAPAHPLRCGCPVVRPAVPRCNAR